MHLRCDNNADDNSSVEVGESRVKAEVTHLIKMHQLALQITLQVLP